MDIRLVTALVWTLLWGLFVASFVFERHLLYLMKPPTDASAVIREYRKTIRNVSLSWQSDVPPSPWETLSWEQKMSWMRRRSALNWATAAAGIGFIVSFVFYSMYELDLMAQAAAGDIPRSAVMLLNRPEVIYQMLVLIAGLIIITWVRKNPL